MEYRSQLIRQLASALTRVEPVTVVMSSGLTSQPIAPHLNHDKQEVETVGIFAWIVVGLIAGWATGKLMRGSGYGVIMDLVVGIVGALIGGFIMRSLGFAGQGGMIYTILVAIGGAVILTWIIRLVTGGRGGGRGDKDINIRRAA
jgi:uncharacterized membrane protein YeaQ/YmgE (transglycosylase-associated protein family)